MTTEAVSIPLRADTTQIDKQIGKLKRNLGTGKDDKGGTFSGLVASGKKAQSGLSDLNLVTLGLSGAAVAAAAAMGGAIFGVLGLSTGMDHLNKLMQYGSFEASKLRLAYMQMEHEMGRLDATMADATPLLGGQATATAGLTEEIKALRAEMEDGVSLEEWGKALELKVKATLIKLPLAGPLVAGLYNLNNIVEAWFDNTFLPEVKSWPGQLHDAVSGIEWPDWVGPKLKDIDWGSLWADLENKFLAFEAQFNENWHRWLLNLLIAPHIIESWESFKDFMMETVPGWAKTGWKESKKFFTETIPGWAKTGWKEAANFFIHTIPSWAQYGWNKVSEFFTETIPGWATTGWEGTKHFFTSTIPSWAKTGWNWTKDFFTKTLPGWIRVAFDFLGKFFVQDIPGFFRKMVAGINGMISWLINMLNKLPGVNINAPQLPLPGAPVYRSPFQQGALSVVINGNVQSRSEHVRDVIEIVNNATYSGRINTGDIP